MSELTGGPAGHVAPWVAGHTIYQIHSLGAVGAPALNVDAGSATPTGRGLRKMEGWLDHVARLGCRAVLLTPIHVSSTHGYDTVDPLRVDQRLGDDDDFGAFVEACHSRGLRLVLDGVFNHVGRRFPPFVDVVENGDRSPYASWFHLDFSRDEGDGFAYRCFEGHRELVVLNHAEPAVAAWAATVAHHWLERGADGWRLDVAYAVPPSFLSELAGSVRRRHPDAFVFGEMIHGDYAGFVAASGLDSVTQYELHKAIWSSLNDANFFELAWSLKRHRSLLATFPPVTFAGNHDVSRLATSVHERAHLPLALAVLFTVPGVPCVYYGDEFGWTGLKTEGAGGDDAIRPALPASPHATDEAAAALVDVHRQLIAMRSLRPWLIGADLEVEDVANRQLAYTVRDSHYALRVALDVDGGSPTPPEGWQLVMTMPGVTISEPDGTW